MYKKEEEQHMKVRLIWILAVLFVVMVYCYLFYGNCLFFLRFIVKPKQTGSIMPTSQTAAIELVQPMVNKATPRTILEVGAGTGPVTKVIIEHLAPEDHLDVLEIDPALCDLLQERFKEYHQVHIHCTPVERWQPAYHYDVVISTVPLSNLTFDEVDLIINQFRRLIKSRGVLSYLEYIGGSEIKALAGQKKEQHVADRLKQFRDQHQTQTVSVLANVPPTYVHHVTL